MDIRKYCDIASPDLIVPRVPVPTVRSACLSASDEGAVVEALIGVEIAWIVKPEDAELHRLE